MPAKTRPEASDAVVDLRATAVGTRPDFVLVDGTQESRRWWVGAFTHERVPCEKGRYEVTDPLGEGEVWYVSELEVKEVPIFVVNEGGDRKSTRLNSSHLG